MPRNAYVIVRAILARLSEPALSGAAGETPPTPEVSPTPPVSPGAAIAQLRQQWAPVIQAVVAACEGQAQAAAHLQPLLAQLSHQDDWRHLVAALRRILAGERDPAALLPGLDATDTLIASDLLRALGVEVGQDLPDPGNRGGRPQPGEQALTLDDLLGLVAQAGTEQAPPGLGEQLFGLTRAMATQPQAPAEMRELGRVLNHVLSGERAPDLSALPPELAAKVRQMLAALPGGQ
ncbi:MAG: hypothetical protein ISS49_05585 [Anaerolineae bacterium]|nr:hypothetical protein [Anaerolineae bacterium]